MFFVPCPSFVVECATRLAGGRIPLVPISQLGGLANTSAFKFGDSKDETTSVPIPCLGCRICIANSSILRTRRGKSAILSLGLLRI